MKKNLFFILLMIFSYASALVFPTSGTGTSYHSNQKIHQIKLNDLTIIFKDKNLNCDKVLNYPYQVRCYNYNYRESIASLYYIDVNVKKSYKKRLNFKQDPNIPEIYQNKIQCYYKSGYDKGHLAPDADFDYNLTILKTTYLMSNVVPELPIMNRYRISKAEALERYYAVKFNGLYVLTGIIPSNLHLKNDKNCARIPYLVYKILITKDKKVFALFIFKKDKYDYIQTEPLKDRIIKNNLNIEIK